MTIPETDELASIPRELPEGAVEEITNRWENGNKEQAFYRIGGEKVWYRSWLESGQLDMEYGIANDWKHGPYRTWHSNGQPYEVAFYYHGTEHGITRQYDSDGTLIGSYTMHYGTGLDCWYQGIGVISEQRQYLDGRMHGFERWYFGQSENDESTRVWRELHYQHGEKHGIHREWNNHGGFRRGYPKYFVNGVQVPKRKYLAACKQDASLPPYRKEEDDWHRTPLTP